MATRRNIVASSALGIASLVAASRLSTLPALADGGADNSNKRKHRRNRRQNRRQRRRRN